MTEEHKGARILQPDLLPVKPSSREWAEQPSTSLIDSDVALLRNKADAWDAHVFDVQRNMELINAGKFEDEYEIEMSIIDDAKYVKSLCERYGLESPF